MREAVKDGSVETLYSERAGRRLAYIQPSMTKVQRLRVTCCEVHGLVSGDQVESEDVRGECEVVSARLCNSLGTQRSDRRRQFMEKDVLFNHQYRIQTFLNIILTIPTYPKARAKARPHQPAQC
jgi:hypothetical protein